MDRNIQEKILAFCEEYHLLTQGDGVVVGLSGGADSVCLVHFLKSIQEKYELQLYAVHVHHGIRGAEADRDEEYAGACAASLDIPYESVHYDIPALAARDGMSVEEAGRHYRYQCFREIAERMGYQKIAVAHHQNDQAETVLFQLLRGSGLRGLGGIRPHQEGIIRPLLNVTRQEIEEALLRAGITWREDATNQDTSYARNKMRQEVIPYLQREIQPETVGHVADTAMQLQGVWQYLQGQVKMTVDRLVHREPDRLWFERSAFFQTDPVLQPYILLELMAELAGSRKDLGKIHVQGWMQLIHNGTGKRITLPYGLQAGRDYERIWLARGSGQSDVADELPGEVTMQCCPRSKLSAEIPKNHCTKWFDYAKIGFGFVWRHPMHGDYLIYDRQGHQKKLSRILLDEKVPRKERERIWVLADGNNVLWIPQIGRTSMGYYVTPETEEVLVVSIDGERWKIL